MKGIRYSTQQKFRILREVEGRGKPIEDVCRGHQISEQTFYRWKRAFGMLGMKKSPGCSKRKGGRCRFGAVEKTLGKKPVVTRKG